MSPMQEAADRARPTVLVAEDDPDYRAIMSSVLTNAGYEVVECSDGGRALELLAEAADGLRECPAVLVADFCMPELSGLGLLRVVRRFRCAPPTVLVTAFPDRSVEAFARAAGAVEVLRKPFRGSDLRAAVAAACSAQRR